MPLLLQLLLVLATASLLPAQTSDRMFAGCVNHQTLPPHWAPERLVLQGGRWAHTPTGSTVQVLPDSQATEVLIYPKPVAVSARKVAEESLRWRVVPPPPPVAIWTAATKTYPCGDTLPGTALADAQLVLQPDSLFRLQCPTECSYQVREVLLARDQSPGQPAPVMTLSGDTPELPLPLLLRGRPPGAYVLYLQAVSRITRDGKAVVVNGWQACVLHFSHP
jgi:hypothetical protein